jgi:hypothetical protein
MGLVERLPSKRLSIHICSSYGFFAGLFQMTGNQEVPGRKRRSGDEIKRLVFEFEASGLRQNE